MKVKRAIILGAGFGKRMLPITKSIPKPLIKINGITLLENSIKFLNSIGINYIVVNTFHLHKEIINFLNKRKLSIKVEVIIEKKRILNTGGGVLNASKKFKKKPFYVLNPDTLWRKAHKKEFKELEKQYLKNKRPTMLLISKKKSFDKSFKGDFNINSKHQISRQKNNKLIFTGAQIIDRSVFKRKKVKPFSMNNVWNKLILKKQLYGVISKQKFFHINNYKIYKKLEKKTIR